MRVCQYCARFFEPAASMAPRGYCCQLCAKQGEAPYSKAFLKPHDPDEDLKLFATKLIEQYHYDNHCNVSKSDCSLDLCLEAKILGL